MSSATRLVVVAAVALLAVAGSVAYIVTHRPTPVPDASQSTPTASSPRHAAISELQPLPHIAFRSVEPGDDYGMLGMVPLDDPSAARATSSVACDRLASSPTRTICVVADALPLQNSRAELLTPTLEREADIPLIGSPSRARISPDGAHAATTTFRSGDSYATPGAFSTQTLISGSGIYGDLEAWTLHRGDETVTAIDRNFWGVTFAADGDTFYATAAWGGTSRLVQGSIKARRMETLREDAECPSLSPDGRHLVYKKLGNRGPGSWRLAALDLATGVETGLAEPRTVDDQVEWLDDGHVLYAVARSGLSEASVADIYVLPTDGTGAPAVLIPGATSPSVVREATGS